MTAFKQFSIPREFKKKSLKVIHCATFLTQTGVFSPFMEYLPYIMLLQTLVLVVIEKFTFKIPRIAQKVERFYKNIVEESLFGKDPDVAEVHLHFLLLDFTTVWLQQD